MHLLIDGRNSTRNRGSPQLFGVHAAVEVPWAVGCRRFIPPISRLPSVVEALPRACPADL